MLKKTVSVIAIAVGLGLVPVAVAQAQTGTTTPPATTEPSAQPDATTPSTATTPTPAMPDASAPDTSAQAPGSTMPAGDSADTMETGGNIGTSADSSPTSPPTTPGQTAATTDDEEGRVIDGQITMQSEGTYLGSDLIGTTVYSSGDESIGDINDVIIATNGTVEGVVVGVGGFLGIGQKNVAIQLDKVDMRDQGDNTVKLVVSSTKEELEQAPEFKTAADMRSESENNNAGTTGMAPAAPGAAGTDTGTGATGTTPAQ